MKKYIPYLLTILLTSCSYGPDKESTELTHEISADSKDMENNPHSSKFVEENNVYNKVKIDFNYIYSEDINSAIQNLTWFSNKNGVQILMLPLSTEEFPTYNILTLTDIGLLNSYTVQIRQKDCNDFSKLILVDVNEPIKLESDAGETCQAYITDEQPIEAQSVPRLTTQNRFNSESESIRQRSDRTEKSKRPLDLKIYFDNNNMNSSNVPEYVIRQTQTNDPLSFSIKSYLDGVSEQEAALGFKTNNLGIDSFNMQVENKTALIDFMSSNLNIKDPEQVLNFDYNIYKTAEQFNEVDDVKICINHIYNYQMAFLANEEIVECPFKF